MKIGIDVGSTTVKAVVFDDENNIIYKTYERHFSHIVEKVSELLSYLDENYAKGKPVVIAISGSAGMGLADTCDVPFVQEVYATRVAIKKLIPDANVIIELGGEDAKILFLTGGMEVRMNGSCAGGTGAFIDQMATLLKVTPDELNECSKESEKKYTIASRCGVFAKTDIQPLINQGAKTSDIAASIFSAVVNQTIAGLAQGRKIAGNVVYLGGPLTFFSELRKSFDETLNVKGICPDNSLYFVAQGAAFYSDRELPLGDIIKKLREYGNNVSYASEPALFKDEEEYREFKERHAKASVPTYDFSSETGNVYIGIDSGSTTVKAAVINDKDQLLFTRYQSNSGNPIPIIKQLLIDIYQANPNAHIVSVTTTGYGEDIVKCAFGADYGVVETVAHFTAAKHFMPDVDFVIDIGGQDMKCFKIEDGAISNIFLNEACSSGCGSFLQTFAEALGYTPEEFAKLAVKADMPVDLGSRCTVFMNSSVKQAQKDGASIENISAGLAMSVVKNALYKVIRVSSPDELGKKIVVQGGTFLNDAVLRAFEKEMGVNVIRPDIAGLMGAFGAALYGKAKAFSEKKTDSTLLSCDELINFTHEIRSVNCGKCGNNCHLTVNLFPGGKKFISGNRCDRPVTNRATNEHPLNMMEFKQRLLLDYTFAPGSRKMTIGIPMGLNMYDMLPFWSNFFASLGFGVITSPDSSRKLYLDGQSTIPSDTVCYPAKLMHGHIHNLCQTDVDAIFYPCMTYNFDEGLGDNNYNCPVVAYYPEVIAANVAEVKEKTFIYDYVGVHRRNDFPKKMTSILSKYFPDISYKEVLKASDRAYEAYDIYQGKVKDKGMEIIRRARREGRRIIVLAGRPYHIDSEINHGIDKLICSYGAAVLTEDCLSGFVDKFPTDILNQWTFHSRMYAAAKYIADQKDMNLIQLVSFGCGVDAITTDEIREILQSEGKLYTQIKIDEITNLGAVNIRLRSLFAALEEQEQ